MTAGLHRSWHKILSYNQISELEAMTLLNIRIYFINLLIF